MINNKKLIVLISGLIFTPVFIAGIIIGTLLLGWVVQVQNSLIIWLIAPFFAGAIAGSFTGWCLIKVIGSNKNFLSIIIAPIMITIILSLKSFYPINITDDWKLIYMVFTSLFFFIYYVKIGKLR